MEAASLFDWFARNWVEVGLGVMVADKIVTITPCKWDDMILSSIKSVVGIFTPGRKRN